MEKFIYEGIEINNIDEWWKKQNYYFSHSTKDFQKFRKATDDFIWQFIRESINTDFDYDFVDFVEELVRENEFLYSEPIEVQTYDFDIIEGFACQDLIFKNPLDNNYYAIYIRETRDGTFFDDGFEFRKVIPHEESVIKYIDEED